MVDKALRGPERPLLFLGSDGSAAGNMTLMANTFDLETDVPPPHLMQYGEAANRHLSTGKLNADQLLRALTKGGYAFKAGHRFLDFGCANGRVLRWFKDWAEQGEGWGVDINANPINWCSETLSPPFHFALTSTFPHLPFEDRYFDLIFANSVFTHIDDTFFSWIQELRRVTQLQGYLYVTIIDETGAARMNADDESLLLRREKDTVDVENFMSGKANFLALRRGGILTLVRSDFFTSQVKRWFDVSSVVPNTVGGNQTGYLLRRKS